MPSGCLRATTENSSNCNSTSQPIVSCQSRIKNCRGMDLAVEYKKSLKMAGLPGEQLFNLLSCLFHSLSANIMEKITPRKCTGFTGFGVLSGCFTSSFWTSRAKVTKQRDHLNCQIYFTHTQKIFLTKTSWNISRRRLCKNQLLLPEEKCMLPYHIQKSHSANFILLLFWKSGRKDSQFYSLPNDLLSCRGPRLV